MFTELPGNDTTFLLANSIFATNIVAHLEQLLLVAKENGGSRAVMLGYKDSAQYVMDVLKNRTNCQVLP